MSEPRSKDVPMDPGRVHILDPLDVAYWCNELNCSEAQLGAAVAAVGEHVTEVRRHLAASRGTAPQPHRRHA